MACRLSISSTVQYPLRFSLRFLENNRNGLVGPFKDFTLAPNQALFLPDVLNSAFGLDQAFGAIQLQGTSGDFSFGPGLVVQAQTSTPAPGGGSFGQSVPGVPRDSEVRLGTARSIAGIQENSAFRTNLVLANSSEAQAEVELELFDAGDAALGSQRVVLQPLGMTQLNRVVRTFGVAGEIAGAICFCRPRNRSAVSPPTRR